MVFFIKKGRQLFWAKKVHPQTKSWLHLCQKATGGNHSEYSEVHVLQYIDQNLAQKQTCIITWSEKLD